MGTRAGCAGERDPCSQHARRESAHTLMTIIQRKPDLGSASQEKEKNHETCIKPSTDKRKGQLCAVEQTDHDPHPLGRSGSACPLLSVRRHHQADPVVPSAGSSAVGSAALPAAKAV